jgi:hypothetical protein
MKIAQKILSCKHSNALSLLEEIKKESIKINQIMNRYGNIIFTHFTFKDGSVLEYNKEEESFTYLLDVDDKIYLLAEYEF